MKLPTKIDIQIVCVNEDDLSDIIVRLTVRAGTKNPYYIYFAKTNTDGKTSIDAEEFMDQFRSHYYEIGLMDYDGTIESASQAVSLDLHYQDQLGITTSTGRKRYLLGYERLKWKSSDELIAYYLSCRNDNFISEGQSVEIRENEVINFVIKKNPVTN